MKKLIVILFTLIIVFGIYVAAKNFFIRRLFELSAEKALGININIKDIDVSFLAGHLRIEGLTIDNPEAFEKREMAYIPLIEIVCDRTEYIKNKKVFFYLFDLNIERINIIRNNQGQVNIKALKAIDSDAESKKTKFPFMIKVLELSMGDIYYIDYYKAHKPKLKRYIVDIKDALFSNIDSPQDIINLVIFKILSNTNIGEFIGMSVIPIAKDIEDIVVLPGKIAKDTVKGVFGIPSLFKIK